MGADPESDNTVARLQVIAQQQQVNALLHAGDISYADGIQRRWDQYMRKVEPIGAYLPYMVVPGYARPFIAPCIPICSLIGI